MTIDPNDPKLTAYVLGELDEQDHAEVEAAISQSSDLRRIVDEIRNTTDLLAKELVGESSISLSADQRTAIEAEAAKPRVRGRLSRIRRAHWFAPLGAGASIAAVLAIAFSLGQVRYGEEARLSNFFANVKGIATSSRIYDADTNERWMIPHFSSSSTAWDSASWNNAYNASVSRSDTKRKTRRARPSLKAKAVANGWGNPVHPSQYASSSDSLITESTASADPSDELVFYKDDHSGIITVDGSTIELDTNGEDSIDRFLSPSSGDVECDDEGNYAFAENEAPGGRAVRIVPSSSSASRIVAGIPTLFDERQQLDGPEEADSGSAGLTMTSSPRRADDVERLVQILQEKEPKRRLTSNRTPPQAANPNAKIIKTGSLTLEVEGYVLAVDRMRTLAIEHGAVVADASTSEQTGGALSGRLVIRVSPEQFEALFAALKAIGQIEAENVKAADVTANYVDLESRISSLKITQARLAELVTNKSFVDKMSALLEVEREMTRVRSQLEQLMGQLRVMADRVALSTITVSLHEPARIVPSASMSVEVPVLNDAATTLGAALNDLGGRLISGKTSKRDGGTLKGDYQLQINLAKFAELLEAVETLGRVEQRWISDRQFGSTTAPWAQTVQCNLALVIFERSRQLPAGSIQIEVADLKQSLADLDVALTDHDGSIVSNQTSRRPDGSGTAELKLRVSAGQFADVVESITTLGRVTGKAVSGEAGRIVGGLARVPCEISLTLAERVREVPSGSITLEVEAFETARQQLSSLVADKGVQVLASSSNQRTDGSWAGYFQLGIKAGEMDAVLTRLESLGRVASRQIIGLGLGDLSRIDPSAVGTIRLTLGEKAAINPGPERTGDSLRSRLRDGLAGLYTSLGFIAYGLIVMAPWLVVVVLLVWLVMRSRRRVARSKAVVN